LLIEKRKKKKQKIRKQILLEQNNFSEKFVASESEIIQSKVISSALFKDAKSIFVYQSFGKEVRTDEIISEAKKQGKKVFSPKKDGSDMHTFEGIQFDLVIAPCLGMAEDGVRLGRGGGYYDRFLAAGHFNKVIVLCYDKFVFKELPCEELDIKIKDIITAK
jgi:5-formyltetrahydrofolate cyclo-ligase